MSGTSDARHRARLQLVLIAAVFLGTPLLASFWYAYGDKGHHGDTVNKGTLIDPPRPVADAAALGLLDTWSLVVIAPQGCAVGCEHTLITLRQVRLTFTHDGERLARVLVSGAAEADRARLAVEHPDLRVLDVAAAPGLIAARGDRADAAADGRAFVVDPLGNLMMTYAPDPAPQDVKSDLVRLLKISESWMKR